MSDKKRKVPSKLREVLSIDVTLTKELHHWAVKRIDLDAYKQIFKALEISCHNVTWILFWLALILVYKDEQSVQLHMNLLLGVILDVISVAVLKAYARRRSPVEDAKETSVGQSFPSGQASRAVFVACFFTYLYPLDMFSPLLFLWAGSVCTSRILSYKHHILDVFGGAVLGFVVYYLLSVFYIDADTAVSLTNYFE